MRFLLNLSVGRKLAASAMLAVAMLAVVPRDASPLNVTHD